MKIGLQGHTADLAAHTSNLGERIRIGQYLLPFPRAAPAEVSNTENSLWVGHYWIPRKMTFDRMAIDVRTAVADYVTGTALFTNASTAVVGTGTVWAAGHVGRKIKNNTDGTWYVIAAVTDNLNLTIASAYAGATTPSEAYTIRATARLGFYNDGTNCYPGSLAINAGEVELNAVAIVAIAINQQLNGGHYYSVVLSNGAPGLSAQMPSYPIWGVRTTSFWTMEDGLSKAYSYGVLPNPFPAGAGFWGGTGTKALLRVASLD